MSGLLPNWTAMICAHYPPLHGTDVAKSLSWKSQFTIGVTSPNTRMMAWEEGQQWGQGDEKQSYEGLFLLSSPQGPEPQGTKKWQHQVILLSQEAGWLHTCLYFIVYEWKTY